MTVRSQRSIRDRLGVDSRGNPVFIQPGYGAERIPISRQFHEARRRASYPIINVNPQFEHTFARVSVDWMFNSAGIPIAYPLGKERMSEQFGPNRTMLLTEATRTNFLLNALAPATQTTGALSTGNHTLWVIGSGSAAVAQNSATITGAGTATQGSPVTFNVTVGGTVNVTVTGSLYFFQLENAAYPSSPIVTGGTTHNRTVDRMIWTPTLRGSGLFGAEGTIVTNFMFQVAGSGNQAVLSIDDGTDNERLTLIHPTGGANLMFRSVDGGVQTAEANAGVTITANTFYKAAIAWSAAGIAVACNGNAAVTAAGAMPSGLTSLCYGHIRGAANLNGYVGIISRYHRRLTNAQLVDLSRGP